MEKEFIDLTQGDKTVDQYASDFLRLSRFAPSMVADEEDKANRLQQGLKSEIRKQLSSHQLDTYSQVLTAARRVELEVDKDRVQQRPPKRTFDQMNRGPAPPQQQQDKPQIQPPPAPRPVCNHCHKLGHIERDCRMKKGLCLICGSDKHKAARYPSRIMGHPVPKDRYPAQRALPAPPLPVFPNQNRLPPPPQGQRHQPGQQGTRAGRGVGRVYQMEVTEAGTSDDPTIGKSRTIL